MAQEEFEYRGRRIAVEVVFEGARFGWRFQIADEKPIGLRQSPAADARQALAEARAAARSVLDLREGDA